MSPRLVSLTRLFLITAVLCTTAQSTNVPEIPSVSREYAWADSCPAVVRAFFLGNRQSRFIWEKYKASALEMVQDDPTTTSELKAHFRAVATVKPIVLKPKKGGGVVVSRPFWFRPRIRITPSMGGGDASKVVDALTAVRAVFEAQALSYRIPNSVRFWRWFFRPDKNFYRLAEESLYYQAQVVLGALRSGHSISLPTEAELPNIVRKAVAMTFWNRARRHQPMQTVILSANLLTKLEEQGTTSSHRLDTVKARALIREYVSRRYGLSIRTTLVLQGMKSALLYGFLSSVGAGGYLLYQDVSQTLDGINPSQMTSIQAVITDEDVDHAKADATKSSEELRSDAQIFLREARQQEDLTPLDEQLIQDIEGLLHGPRAIP